MVRLTEKMKNYITEYPDLSHRKLAEKLSKEFETKVSHTTVANFRKNKPVKIETLQKITVPEIIPKTTPIRISPPRSRKKKYPLSIDQVNKLLQANKDHYHYKYLNKMINNPGKLRADFEKLLVFIRDRV